MTYKLDPVIEKIEAPVVLIMPDSKKLQFDSGKIAANETFDRSIVIKRITTDGNRIVIEVEEKYSSADSSLFDGA